ncbi:hypothetical protein [Streptomyces sp. NPDC058678]|uniref:hypothetical protein n=1 Tax=Streptomyces sp. NPDC058678 TaxID=3346595 RepID=UPI003661AD9C
MTVRKTILHVVAAGVLVAAGTGLAAGTAAAADASSSSSSSASVSVSSAALDTAGLMSQDDSGWQGNGS